MTTLSGSAGGGTTPDAPATGSTLRELIHERALAQPDAVAFVFVVDGDTEERVLTYGELDERARGAAASIRARSDRGARALLLFPPGLEFIVAFVGCLYANVVAVPAYPPATRRGAERLATIARDAQTDVVVTGSDADTSLFGRGGESPIRLDSDSPVGDAWVEEPALPTELALLQYTSGSTRTPRGVRITHANLLRNQESIERAFGTSRETVFVSWLPFYHDMGLIGNLLQPLSLGTRCVLLSPLRFLQRPARWLEAITRHGGTLSGGPNFAYDLCCDRIDESERRKLDLSSWTLAYNGAEPIRAGTLERFAASFGPSGFRYEAFHPCYGLAEATLMVASGTLGEPPVVRGYDVDALESQGVALPATSGSGRTLVSSGRPCVERLAIVGADGIEVQDGSIGEIWVSDGCVADGYWNEAAETDEFFHARLTTDDRDFLRTGDGGFIDEGELFITSRLKDVIIVRGRNYAPHDIEQTVEESDERLRRGCSAAFSVDVAGEEQLVVAQEIVRGVRPDDYAAIVAAIRGSVAAEHELRVYAVVLLRPGGIPKTSSNKVQRATCRASFLEGTLKTAHVDAVAPVAEEDVSTPALTRDDILAAPVGERVSLLRDDLVRRLAAALGGNVGEMEHDVPLAGLGLDSIGVITLQHDLKRDFGDAPSASALLEDATIDSIAEMLLAGIEQRTQAPVVPADEAGKHRRPFGKGGSRLLARLDLWWLAEKLRVRQLIARLYRVEIRGAEHVPSSGPCILVANHESVTDPWFLALSTPRPVRFMAKAELWRYPGIGRALEACGVFPIERGTGDTGAIAHAGKLLDDGELLGMFPTGTSKPRGNRTWHLGAARLALAHGAVIVPVRLENTRQVLPRRRMRVIVGPPIRSEPDIPTIAAARALTRQAEAAVEALA